MVREISIQDYDYSLPEERIPKHPSPGRDDCRLLVCSPAGTIYHKQFKNLPDLLPPASLLVWNDTKVINARLMFQKETGAVIEVFLLEPVSPADYEVNFQSHRECVWKCLVGNLKKWKNGPLLLEICLCGETLTLKAEKEASCGGGETDIRFSWCNPGVSFAAIIEAAGTIPIPPYLNRDSEESDKTDYQTVFALMKGSVAAPTAGLHFTPKVIEGIRGHGVGIEKVTLHVGAGTFRPVKENQIGNHSMHSEPFSVRRELIDKLIDAKEKRRNIVATGTTTVRTLESLPYIGRAVFHDKTFPVHVEQWEAYDNPIGEEDSLRYLKEISSYLEREKLEALSATTSIIIAPGFHWNVTDAMITNFHQPKSTLLLLVSSFIGRRHFEGKWKEIYEEALAKGYRFLSYGDAMLLVN